MTLDPQVRDLLDRMAAFEQASGPPPPDEGEAVRMAREAYDQQTRELFGTAEGVGAVQELEAPGPAGPVPMRVYTPLEELPPDVVARAAVLFAHGGGWINGSLDSHDGLCRALCNGSGAIVAAVGYRLAPEHPFPAAVEDCLAALGWLSDNAPSLGADARRLGVAGDSAGGNIMAAVCRRVRDGGGPAIALQALLYPALDATMDSESYRSLGDERHGLTREAMERSWRLYLDGHDRRAPDASPVFLHDLVGLPPALVLTCGYDPLRDEGELYARRLREAGVPVAVIRADGMAHGFLRWRGQVDAAHRVLDEVCEALRPGLTPDAATGSGPVPGSGLEGERPASVGGRGGRRD